MFPPKFDAKAGVARELDARSEKVIVAVKAEKVISKTALAWALSNVVRPGDCVTLLAVLSAEKTGLCCNSYAPRVYVFLTHIIRIRSLSYELL